MSELTDYERGYRDGIVAMTVMIRELSEDIIRAVPPESPKAETAIEVLQILGRGAAALQAKIMTVGEEGS